MGAGGSDAGRAIPLTSETVILGRRPIRDPEFPDAQLISLDDDTRTVSKTHARLELRDERWFITDLDSTNGVLFATPSRRRGRGDTGRGDRSRRSVPARRRGGFASPERRMTGTGREDDLPDDATIRSPARGDEDTQPAGGRDEPVGPRRRAEAAESEEPDDGSTMVVRRESRRRAARDAAGVAPPPERSAADLPAPNGRIAHAPEGQPPIYKPRAPEPVIADRSAPPARPPQTPIDTRAALLSRRRRARQLALVAVIGGCFVITVLLAALIAFTTTAGL